MMVGTWWNEPSVTSVKVLAQYFKAEIPAAPKLALITDHASAWKKIWPGKKMPVENFLGLKYVVMGQQSHACWLVKNICMGGPAMAVTLELLAEIGVRNITVVGTAGAIDETLSLGDILVVERAIRDEGTSAHYLPPAKWVDAPMGPTAAVAEILLAKKIAFRLGAVWSTDAVFRESPSRIGQFRSEGAQAVEMESATAFALAKCKGLELSCVKVISDRLTPDLWVPGFRDARVVASLDRIHQVMVEEYL